MNPDFALTLEGLDALRTEIRALREKHGRIAEDATFRDERLLLEARIATLEDVLEEAWIVEPSALEPGVVAIGVEVELRDVETDGSERYRVVGKHEPLRAGELSAASAVGRAVLGRQVGETVGVDLPNGHARRLEVVSAAPRTHAA
jgi:transcription elongation factor GreA